MMKTTPAAVTAVKGNDSSYYGATATTGTSAPHGDRIYGHNGDMEMATRLDIRPEGYHGSLIRKATIVSATLACAAVALTLLVARNVVVYGAQNVDNFDGSVRSPCAAVGDQASVAEIQRQIRALRGDVQRIIHHVTVTEKGESWKQLAEFVDRFGPRLAGTTDLEDAIDDRIKHLSQTLGPKQVSTESVAFPKWTRGDLELTLLNAWNRGRNKSLHGLALGSSVATPKAGITAEAIVVRSFDELNAMKDEKITGKIVVYNQRYKAYQKTVLYRTGGASAAAAKGAVAVLVRSVTDASLYTPHTGVLVYAENSPMIPAISITAEDAELMWRKQQRGEKLMVYLRTTSHTHIDEAISRNTIADLKGNKAPDELVVIGGHIDSWDVGQGAMDDGGGVLISWRVPEVLTKLELKPRRTIRTVLFTAEELGLYGGHAYFNGHKHEAAKMQYIMESDYGTFTPFGISTSVKNDKALCILWETVQLLDAINATVVQKSNDGPDIQQWFQRGVPGGGLYNDNARYFHYHHTNADTMSMMSANALDRCTAVWAAVAYVLAEIETRIPHDSVSA